MDAAGRLDTASRNLRRGLLLIGILAGSALMAGPAAQAGAVTTEGSQAPESLAQPWTDEAHDTPLELLADRIASHIAGRAVGVDCETGAAWATLARQQGVNPAAESAYVATSWNSDDGQLLSSSTTAVLAPGICASLDRLAVASSKPAACPGDGRETVSLRAASRPAPCRLGAGAAVVRKLTVFPARYAASSIAVLTLAHESIHLSGIVGGTLSDGLVVGDPRAEAKADCYGMQWMPYVAEQLGDSPADAHALATYFWQNVYPLGRTDNPAYWSQACRPGGALDLGLHTAKAWP